VRGGRATLVANQLGGGTGCLGDALQDLAQAPLGQPARLDGWLDGWLTPLGKLWEYSPCMANRGFVLVTGASTGIGEACARRLDQEGFVVFAGVRRAEDAQRLRQQSPGLVPVMLDVTDAESIAQAVAAIDRRAGEAGLAGLVNNAGISVAGPLEYLSIDDLRRQFEVNVIGQIAVTQACLPLLRAATGRLVFIGSISGRMAAPVLGPYSASKFALAALCDALRAELLPWGLHVVLVEPGSVATPIWQKGLDEGEVMAASLSDVGRERYRHLIAAVRQAAAAEAKAGIPADRVADVVLRALAAPRPRTRYLVGTDAKARAWIALLPDRWRDALIRRALRLPAPAVSA